MSQLRALLRTLLRLLLPLALLSTTYLYLYPLFHLCAFPSSISGSSSADSNSLLRGYRDTLAQHLPWSAPQENRTARGSRVAPFRLLVLADPQIEGDSSLPAAEDGLVARLGKHWRTVRDCEEGEQRWEAMRGVVREVLTSDGPRALNGLRKRVDLWGNDYYLAHIYRTMRWLSGPSHVTVLGDLIGSQWVSDEEFEERGRRYWGRVVKGGERVGEDVTVLEGEDGEERLFEIEDEEWKRRIINIAGNHDIGYAGDISEARLGRFERVFGKANWDVRFQYPATDNVSDGQQPPSLHLVVLNSLVLDTPAMSTDIQSATYEYLNGVINKRLRPVEDKTSFTLTLTHLPLFKKAGICVDAPYFDFWPNDDGGGSYHPRGLKEQNHLSRHASEPGLLESLYGMKGDIAVAGQGKGRPGLILNGHDHAGCDTFHFIPQNETWNSSAAPAQEEEKKTEWSVSRWTEADLDSAYTGVREVTLRSMMGDFSGNAGLLSAWFDFDAGQWRYDIQMCKLGVQHVWWAVHIIDLVAGVLLVLATVEMLIPRSQGGQVPPKKELAEKEKQKPVNGEKKT
jgi:hypothetical protein